MDRSPKIIPVTQSLSIFLLRFDITVQISKDCIEKRFELSTYYLQTNKPTAHPPQHKTTHATRPSLSIPPTVAPITRPRPPATGPKTTLILTPQRPVRSRHDTPRQPIAPTTRQHMPRCERHTRSAPNITPQTHTNTTPRILRQRVVRQKKPKNATLLMNP